MPQCLPCDNIKGNYKAKDGDDLFEKFCPRAVAHTLTEIEPAMLVERGIRGLILDLDNTLVKWNTRHYGQGVRRWLERARKEGLELCILSNSTAKRVRAITEELNIPGLGSAVKPWGRSFRKAMELLGTKPEETAVLGDQLLTDVYGGNRLGMYTILLIPLSEKELFTTRLVRTFERWLLKYFRSRGMLKGVI